jgi:DNA-binding protein HU-beta
MNKTELITQVAVKTGLKKSQASLAVDTLLESHSTSVAKKGETVPLIGFGTFEVRESVFAREGRNPSTGESLTISARKVPAFKAGKHLKEAVSN